MLRFGFLVGAGTTSLLLGVGSLVAGRTFVDVVQLVRELDRLVLIGDDVYAESAQMKAVRSTPASQCRNEQCRARNAGRMDRVRLRFRDPQQWGNEKGRVTHARVGLELNGRILGS